MNVCVCLLYIYIWIILYDNPQKPGDFQGQTVSLGNGSLWHIHWMIWMWINLLYKRPHYDVLEWCLVGMTNDDYSKMALISVCEYEMQRVFSKPGLLLQLSADLHAPTTNPYITFLRPRYINPQSIISQLYPHHISLYHNVWYQLKSQTPDISDCLAISHLMVSRYHQISPSPSSIIFLLWMVAKSCITKRMVETLWIQGCLPPINWWFGFLNHHLPIRAFEISRSNCKNWSNSSVIWLQRPWAPAARWAAPPVPDHPPRRPRRWATHKATEIATKIIDPTDFLREMADLS